MNRGLHRSGASPKPDAPKAPEALRTRPMTPADVPVVVAIERSAFSTPWHPDSFLSLIGRYGCELRVAENAAGEVVAYAVVMFVLEQAELANIAVRSDLRGCGVGSVFLERTLERVREIGVRELFLEVRESNAAARALYRRYGFEEIGRRRNYYDRPREDALQLVKRFEDETDIDIDADADPDAGVSADE